MIMTFSNKRASQSFPDRYNDMFSAGCRTIQFIVTHDCNLRCSYCYETNKSHAAMPFEIGCRCIDLLFQEDEADSDCVNSDVSHGVILEFIGGEPLLMIERIEEWMDYFLLSAAKRRHRWSTQYMISITTNGVLYDSAPVRRFLKRFEGRASIAVTVDGDKATHDKCRVDCAGCGSYDKAAAALSDVIRRSGEPPTKFTISPQNVAGVFDACRDIITRFHLQSLHCNCVYEIGWTSELASVLYDQLKKLADWVIEENRTDMTLSIFDPSIGKPIPNEDNQNWCGGTGKMIAFDVDGTIYPCLRYAPVSMSGRELLRIGDVEHGIGETASDKETLAALYAITRQSQSSENCLNCPIASGCGWCSAYNYEVTGSVNERVTFICPTHQARVMAASYYHNRLHNLRGESERFALNIPKDLALQIVNIAEYEHLRCLAESGDK